MIRDRPIDIGPWVHGGSDYARARVATALDDALRASGFAQIVGHGIPDSVIGNLTAAIDSLFTLDLATKWRWRFGSSNRGYVPSRSETQSRSHGLEPASGLADWVEGFDVGSSQRDFRHVRVDGISYASSVWPDIPDFQRRIDIYFSEAGRVVRDVGRVLGHALGLGTSFFGPYTDHAVDTLALNWFDNSLASSAHDRGMSEHSDYGLISLGWSDRMPGLEVLHSSGEWMPVVRAEGALLVFAGDLLCRLTNNRWPAGVHRAMPAGSGIRRSAFFFHDGNADAVIAPHPALVPPGTAPMFMPVTVDAHIRGRLASARRSVPYRGSEFEANRIRRSLDDG